MVAERCLTLSTNSLTLPQSLQVPEGYFRSKLFVTSSSSNPFLAAASPLLSLLERLSISPTLPPVESLRENIEHELLAFDSRLISQHGADELSAMAHYLMSATIDELLGKNYVRIDGKPAAFKAFTPVGIHEDSAPEYQFFKIIQVIKERANQYLNLIELAYYCLISGFEGHYHVRAEGRQALDNLIEELHQIIQRYRVSKPYRPFKEEPVSLPVSRTPKSALFMGLVTLGLLAIIYASSQWMLEHQAKNFL